MTFPCMCPACEHLNDAAWSQIGRETRCGACGKPFIVPAPMETVRRPKKKPKELIRFNCPACGKKYSTSGKLAGQKIRCKGCGGGVWVPGGEGVSVSAYSTSFKRKFSEIGDQPGRDLQAAHAPDGARMPHPALPELDPDKAPANEAELPEFLEVIEDDDRESVDDLAPILDDPSVLEGRRRRMQEAILSSRSEAMARVSQELAEEEAQRGKKKREREQRRAQREKRKRWGYFDPKETLRLIGWLSAFVGTIAFLAWGYPHFRFPLGGLLCVTGFIVYLLGWVSLKQLAAEEGLVPAILFRFVPPYQWWYIGTRWSDAKDYVIFFVAGVLILSMGSAIIKTSPAGKKAEASDKAYQKMLKDDERRAKQALSRMPVLEIEPAE